MTKKSFKEFRILTESTDLTSITKLAADTVKNILSKGLKIPAAKFIPDKNTSMKYGTFNYHIKVDATNKKLWTADKLKAVLTSNGFVFERGDFTWVTYKNEKLNTKLHLSPEPRKTFNLDDDNEYFMISASPISQNPSGKEKTKVHSVANIIKMLEKDIGLTNITKVPAFPGMSNPYSNSKTVNLRIKYTKTNEKKLTLSNLQTAAKKHGYEVIHKTKKQVEFGLSKTDHNTNFIITLGAREINITPKQVAYEVTIILPKKAKASTLPYYD